MAFKFDALQALKTATPSATFTALDPVAASANAEVRFTGSTAYNETTGALTGNVTALEWHDSSVAAGALITVTLDSANAATSAADVSAWMAQVHAILAATGPLVSDITFNSYGAMGNYTSDTTNGITTARIALMNGGTVAGYIELVGTGIEANVAPQSGEVTVSQINILNASGVAFSPARTIDYNDPLSLSYFTTAFEQSTEDLGQYIMRGNDTVVGASANNQVLDGGLGNDSITGNGASDWVGYGSAESAVNVSLLTNLASAGGGLDTLSGIENILGSRYSGDNLTGDNNANKLDGGVDNGDDSLVGGLGNDTYILRDGNDDVTESSGQGDDTVTSTITRNLNNVSLYVERLELLGTSAINGTGNSLANTITGNIAANLIDGWTGADSLLGGDGNDTYVVDNTGDTVTETSTGGTDTVKAKGTYVLNAGAYVESLETTDYTLSGLINLTGNAQDQNVKGNNGANILNGGGGTDTLYGYLGNDTYVLAGSTTVTIVESSSSAAGTRDTITSTVTRDLNDFTGIEDLTLLDGAAADGTGNASANKLIGNASANILDGKGGSDTLTGAGGSDDFVWDGLGTDVVTDMVLGTDIVNVAGLNIGDIETIRALALTSGSNTILRKTLNGVVSSVQLNAVAKASLTASHFAFDTTSGVETINGGANIDYLFGADGSDIINGSGNNDWLFGEAGNDTLDGGTGSDRMYGGAGNDTYVVSTLGDVIVEVTAAGADTGGTDLIKSAITYSLKTTNTAFVENLQTTDALATTVINLTGNDLGNLITGNDGANIINGGKGIDTMRGNGGNDTYYVNSGSEDIVEGSGDGTADRVYTCVSYTLDTGVYVESLVASTGVTEAGVTVTTTTAMNLTGNELAQTLIGNAGANVINGKGGNDTLTGGAGADNFRFDTTLSATTNKDTITDFNALYDTIQLDNAVMTALGTTMTSGKFYVGTAAHDLDDRIIYNKATGELSYDSNGSLAGGSTVFAVLSVKPTITYSDFQVI